MAGMGIPGSKDLWSWRDDIAKLEIFEDSQISAEAGETLWCVLCTRIISRVLIGGGWNVPRGTKVLTPSTISAEGGAGIGRGPDRIFSMLF